MPVATAFAQEWVQAWNRRDLESLLSHYSEDVEFRSLLVAKILGEPAGAIVGKAQLRDYFQKVLAAFPGEPGIELLSVYQGVSSLVVLFEIKGRRGAELIEFDANGAVCRAYAHGQAV